jgi:formylglycine-generating enzyme required for sulfatase activity
MVGTHVCCMMRWLAACWIALILVAPAFAQPELAKDIGIREANPGAKFLALVIGVSNYGNAQVKARGTAAPVPIPSLPGPREDAQDIASLVRQMGFVISNEKQMFDLDRSAMQREISRFVSQLDEQTVALVYYSGHGLENQNENFLVPRSANLESVDDLRGQLISLNEMLRDMGNSRAKARIVILDACRNFPDLEGGTKTIGETGGFGEVKIGAGLRLVYAAEPGQRALPARSGERNSVFTRALLSAVREPALGTFDQVIHRAGEITQELTRRSDGSSFQQPWIAGSAGMTFRLRPYRPAPLQPVLGNATVAVQAQEVRLFKDCDVCPDMVTISAGAFLMGSPETEVGRKVDEGPQRIVTINRGFALGQTEITNKQWSAIMGSKPDDPKCGECAKFHVSWIDAQQYIKLLSERAGQVYRLPSEAEWEYSARAGTTTPYYTGLTVTEEQSFYHHANVRRFPPNAWGLFGMSASVAEYVQDCYDKDAYSGKAPRDGRPLERPNCRKRVARGGEFGFDPSTRRSAARASVSEDSWGSQNGFRVARDLVR